MPLGEICFAKSGNSKIIKGTLPTENNGSMFPAYSATGQDVFSDGFDFDGDGIVISAVGARCGKCFLAKGKWRAIANTHVILPKPDRANVRFLWYLLNDESFWVRGGTAQPFVKVGDSLKKQIAVPPLAEQERIVKLLDEADELRKIRGQADNRTAAFLPALFNEMIGNPLTNPKGWPIVLLNEVTSPKQWPTITQEQLTESGFPVYGANGRIGFYSEFNHAEATVLVTCRGATCGTVNVCEPKSYVTGNAMSLDNPNPAVLNVPYLESVLRVRGVKDTITGTAQPQITRQSLARVSFPVPPLPLQKEFAQRVTEIRELEAKQAASRQRLESLFQSMLHRAFNGEL